MPLRGSTSKAIEVTVDVWTADYNPAAVFNLRCKTVDGCISQSPRPSQIACDTFGISEIRGGPRFWKSRLLIWVKKAL